MRFDSDISIFAGSGSEALTQKICESLGLPVGKSTITQFSDNNIYVKIGEKVRGKDVYIVQSIGLDPNNQFMELLFWIDAFKRSSVGTVTAIIPYFGYAKGDKKDESRTSIRARVCADCLEAAGVDRVITMDLHSSQIQGFFKKPVDHLYAANIFIEHIRARGLQNYVIVAPDEGYAKNARYYTDKLGVPIVIGNKKRITHDEKAEILGITGDAEGKDAVIVDDFSISCGTIIEIANILKQNGTKDIYVYVTHGVVSKKGAAALMASPIKTFCSTDTIMNPVLAACPKAEVLSVAGFFGKAIKIIHERDSLSELFE